VEINHCPNAFLIHQATLEGRDVTAFTPAIVAMRVHVPLPVPEIVQLAPPKLSLGCFTLLACKTTTLLGSIAVYYVRRCGLLLLTEYSVRSVGLSVCHCLSVTIVSPVETAEPIDLPFGMWTQMGQETIGPIKWGFRSPRGKGQF